MLVVQRLCGRPLQLRAPLRVRDQHQLEGEARVVEARIGFQPVQLDVHLVGGRGVAEVGEPAAEAGRGVSGDLEKKTRGNMTELMLWELGGGGGSIWLLDQ